MEGTASAAAPNPATGASPAISTGRKLLFTAVVVFGTLFLMEGLVRVRAWLLYGSTSSQITDRLLRHDEELGMLLPTEGSVLEGTKVDIRINSLGFRNPEITREKPADVIRIACLGGSTTFCTEVSTNETTWPHQLELALERTYPDRKFEVINAGIPGCTMASSVKNLRHRVLPLDPDLVILYHAHNDIKQDTRELARAAGLLAEEGKYRGGFFASLAKHSLLVALAQKNVQIVNAQADEQAHKLAELPAHLPDRFIAELAEFWGLLSERGIPLVLSTFQVKYRGDQERAVKIKNADVALFYMPWLTVDLLLEAMDAYNTAIVEFAREHEIPVLDDRGAIPADGENFLDAIHLSDRGCERMAARFERFIVDDGILGALRDEEGRED